MKAKAPFIPVQQNHSSGPKQPEQSIRFFPSLPSIRKRKLYIVQTKVQGEVYAQRRVMDIPLYYLVFLHYFVNMVGDIITITIPSELHPLNYRLLLRI